MAWWYEDDLPEMASMSHMGSGLVGGVVDVGWGGE